MQYLVTQDWEYEDCTKDESTICVHGISPMDDALEAYASAYAYWRDFKGLVGGPSKPAIFEREGYCMDWRPVARKELQRRKRAICEERARWYFKALHS